MPTAAALRKQIEETLSERVPGALSPVTSATVVRMPCGVSVMDEVLQGGLQEGAITELVGAECSGRTTMALAYLAAATQANKVVAWIDVADALDPETVAANGVDLERLLWIRCGGLKKVTVQTAPEAGKAWSDVEFAPLKDRATTATGCGSPHPRSEARGMHQAVSAMMSSAAEPELTRREKKSIGTPGMPNRPISHPTHERVEQPNSDRLPARRGDNLTLAPRRIEPRALVSSQATQGTSCKPWHALDQASRAVDLLLQAGGFGIIVLDLSGTSPEAALRIPLATWFRFRAACERTRVSLLLLTQTSCARSSAVSVIRMDGGRVEREGSVMTGVLYSATAERGRAQPERVVSIRKPPQSAHTNQRQWQSRAPWVRKA